MTLTIEENLVPKAVMSVMKMRTAPASRSMLWQTICDSKIFRQCCQRTLKEGTSLVASSGPQLYSMR